MVTWVNQTISSLRFLLVTPLVVTRFNETELAAWYLFGSLNFFGEMVNSRLGLSYTRMFSYAMGGASNLSPIRGKRSKAEEGGPNWAVFERAYGTIGSLNLFTSLANVSLAFLMGWFALDGMLSGHPESSAVWIAFSIIQFGAFVNFVFMRYSLALKGMNFVALTGRWNSIFSLLSVFAASAVLWMDFGMVVLASVMQGFTLLGILRSRFILKHVEQGRVLGFKPYGFDREVFAWSWEPTWRGMISHFANLSVIQIGSVVYARAGSPAEIASYLLTLRVVQIVVQISGAPFNSVQPLMARLMSAGDSVALRRLYLERVFYSLVLLGLGLGAAAVVGNPLLGLIGSEVSLLSRGEYFVLSVLVLHQWYINYSASIAGIGNNYIMFWNGVASSVVSITIFYFLPSTMTGLYVAMAAWLPRILILNIRPGIIGAKYLELSPVRYLSRLYGYVVFALILVLVGVLLMPYFENLLQECLYLLGR